MHSSAVGAWWYTDLMKNTKTLLDGKARLAVHQGVNAIYQPVKRTLGPHGRSALIYRTYNRGSRITDDGVTVAEVQEPKDPFVRLTAETFKEMCKRTVEKVGDGTTTTAVIGGKLWNDIYKILSESDVGASYSAKGSTVSAMDLRKKILESAEKVKTAITARKQEIKTLEDLERVATISVKDPELGKVVAGMAWDVGVDGYIDVVEGYKGTIETEVIKGMRFPAKAAAKAFVNNPKRYEMVAQDCPVLITNYAMDNGGDVAPVVSEFNKSTSKLIIIAPSFSNNVLVGFAKATEQGYFIFPVACPALRTEQFEDLAVYCGAEFIDKNKGRNLSSATFKDCGFLEKLIVKDTDMRDDAVATGGRGATQEIFVARGEGKDRQTVMSTPVAERVLTLKGQMEEQKEDKFKKLFGRRIASMSSAVGVVRVGESTQASALYRKLKIEDCVYACKAALRGGYVKGGGLCLKEIAEDRDVLAEDDLLIPALLHPYELIQNSVPGGVPITDDVIDPLEAVFYSVEHAAQVVAHLAMVEVITPEIDEVSPGDGYMAIARMVGEYVISNKRQLGLLKENEEEAERDRLQGLTADEKVMLDTG